LNLADYPSKSQEFTRLVTLVTSRLLLSIQPYATYHLTHFFHPFPLLFTEYAIAA
jgi:hypothetical protein